MGPARQVSGFSEYADQTEKWFAELADRGSSVNVSFRFVERIATDCVDCDTDERSAMLEEEFPAAIDVDDVNAFSE